MPWMVCFRYNEASIINTLIIINITCIPSLQKSFFKNSYKPKGAVKLGCFLYFY